MRGKKKTVRYDDDDDDGYDSDNYDYENNPVLKERRKRRQQRRSELYQLILTILQAFSILYSISYYFLQLEPSKTYQQLIFRSIFLILTISFFSLWLLARVQLGTFLTFRPKAHETLVTTGIYSKFRHPIYYFGTLTLVCFLILIEKYSFLLILIILIPVQIYRAVRETKVLKEKFDDIYMDYLKNVWI